MKKSNHLFKPDKDFMKILNTNAPLKKKVVRVNHL